MERFSLGGSGLLMVTLPRVIGFKIALQQILNGGSLWKGFLWAGLGTHGYSYPGYSLVSNWHFYN